MSADTMIQDAIDAYSASTAELLKNPENANDPEFLAAIESARKQIASIYDRILHSNGMSNATAASYVRMIQGITRDLGEASVTSRKRNEQALGGAERERYAQQHAAMMDLVNKLNTKAMNGSLSNEEQIVKDYIDAMLNDANRAGRDLTEQEHADAIKILRDPRQVNAIKLNDYGKAPNPKDITVGPEADFDRWLSDPSNAPRLPRDARSRVRKEGTLNNEETQLYDAIDAWQSGRQLTDAQRRTLQDYYARQQGASGFNELTVNDEIDIKNQERERLGEPPILKPGEAPPDDGSGGGGGSGGSGGGGGSGDGGKAPVAAAAEVNKESGEPTRTEQATPAGGTDETKNKDPYGGNRLMIEAEIRRRQAERGKNLFNAWRKVWGSDITKMPSEEELRELKDAQTKRDAQNKADAENEARQIEAAQNAQLLAQHKNEDAARIAEREEQKKHYDDTLAKTEDSQKERAEQERRDAAELAEREATKQDPEKVKLDSFLESVDVGRDARKQDEMRTEAAQEHYAETKRRNKEESDAEGKANSDAERKLDDMRQTARSEHEAEQRAEEERRLGAENAKTEGQKMQDEMAAINKQLAVAGSSPLPVGLGGGTPNQDLSIPSSAPSAPFAGLKYIVPNSKDVDETLARAGHGIVEGAKRFSEWADPDSEPETARRDLRKTHRQARRDLRREQRESYKAFKDKTKPKNFAEWHDPNGEDDEARRLERKRLREERAALRRTQREEMKKLKGEQRESGVWI
jgi:hypothetical protein